jgi:hypothetical protein
MILSKTVVINGKIYKKGTEIPVRAAAKITNHKLVKQPVVEPEPEIVEMPEVDRGGLDASLAPSVPDALDPLIVDGDLNKVPRIDEIMAEVGDDLDKAALALEVEQAREKPRPTLIAGLQEMLAAGAAG